MPFSIMAVLSTIGIASFVNYSQSQTLQQAVNDFTTTINTAKARAASQVNDVCSGASLSGYDVVLTKTAHPTTDHDSYTLNAICNGVKVPIPPTAKFPSGVSFDSSIFNPPSSPVTVTFSILTGAVSVVPVLPNGIKINGVTAQLSKTISVDSGGNIKILTWTFCANEGAQCSFTGTKEVRYGANDSYYYQIFTNGTPCTNAVFGDPLYGTVKQCYYQNTNP